MKNILNFLKFKKPGPYSGRNFDELKTLFGETINQAYDKLRDVPKSVQSLVIGSGIDDIGPYMVVNRNVNRKDKKNLILLFKDIKDLRIEYRDIPKFL